MTHDENIPPQPGYWAVLPAGIRYDDRIPANAKLLYAEISSLTDKTGFCWADDAYFAALYQFSDRTIRRLLAALEEAGYICIEREAGEHNVTLARRIYAGLNPLAAAPASLDNFVHTEVPVRTKLSGSSDKIVQTHLIKEQEILTRVSNSRKPGPKRTEPEWKPERFQGFWSFYSRIPGERGRRRNENKQAAIRAWDALEPEDALIDAIARALRRQLATPEWSRGVGIPMAATYLNNRRWEDAEALPDPDQSAPAETPREGGRIRWI